MKIEAEKEVKEPFIYLAGPFFNKEQQKRMRSLAEACKESGVNYYWPMEHAEYLPPDASLEKRVSVFYSEIRAIRRCILVLACLDWALPEGSEVRVVRDISLKEFCPYHNEKTKLEEVGFTKFCNCKIEATVVSPPLNLPDNGTVFEMGYANAIKKPIVGWTFIPSEKGRINLMLSLAMARVIHGEQALFDFISGNPERKEGETFEDLREEWFNWSAATNYKGLII